MTILETLGLKRRPKTPAASAARVDNVSMVILAGVIEVEKRLKAAGLSATGRMASTRNAAEALAKAGRSDEAGTQLGDLRTMVDDAVLGQGRWNAAAGQFKPVDAQITQMKGWADPRAAGLGTEMAAVRQALAEHQFDDAVTGFRVLAGKVPGQHRQAVQLREHKVAMQALQPRVAVAEAADGHGNPAHPLKAQWDAFDAAKTASPAIVTDPAKAASLATARATLATATEALIDGFKAGASDAWLQQCQESLWNSSSTLRQKADYVRPATEEQFKLKEAYDAIAIGGTTWAALLESIEQKVDAARALLAASATAGGKDERRFIRRYPAVDERVEAARNTNAAAEPLLTAKAEFDRANTAFQTLYFKDPPDYTGCLRIMDDLAAKADAVLKPRLDAAKTRITTVTGMAVTGADPAQIQLRKTAKAEAARAAIMDDTVLDPLTLKLLPPDEKVALLDALRSVPVPASSAANKADPKRAAQRKVYAAMDLDPAFINAEKQQRKAIVTALVQDKEALCSARDNWTALSPDERKAVLEKMMNAQCAALKCTAPTGGIVVGPIAGNDNGHYDPGADVIRINTDMPVYEDFELASDLIFHENSHNYQFQLSKRLALPDGDKNKLTKTNTDPPYTQARMFASNGAGGGYVIPDEDYAGYQKQPMEDHSWSAGPDTSRRLQKALA